MGNLFFGFCLGVIFSQFVLKLFNIGWKKLEKEIDSLDD
jgi:hypothetical protein